MLVRNQEQRIEQLKEQIEELKKELVELTKHRDKILFEIDDQRKWKTLVSLERENISSEISWLFELLRLTKEQYNKEHINFYKLSDKQKEEIYQFSEIIWKLKKEIKERKDKVWRI